MLNVQGCILAGATRLSTGLHPDRARLDSELLLMHVLERNRAWLMAHGGDDVSEDTCARLQELFERRYRGEPIQYVTGECEFYGLPFKVTEDVLIPRPETEHLVESALALLPLSRALRVIDVGTGSGAIAIAIAHERPLIRVAAIDSSPAALAVARANAARHGLAGRIEFIEADLLSAVGTSSCEMIVSNPPYVATSERASLSVEVREHEPAAALFSGATGYEVYEQLLPQAMRTLKPQGWLLLEIGYGQQAKLRDMLAEHGYTAIRFVEDLQGIPRVAIGQKPSQP